MGVSKRTIDRALIAVVISKLCWLPMYKLLCRARQTVGLCLLPAPIILTTKPGCTPTLKTPEYHASPTEFSTEAKVSHPSY